MKSKNEKKIDTNPLKLFIDLKSEYKSFELQLGQEITSSVSFVKFLLSISLMISITFSLSKSLIFNFIPSIVKFYNGFNVTKVSSKR